MEKISRIGFLPGTLALWVVGNLRGKDLTRFLLIVAVSLAVAGPARARAEETANAIVRDEQGRQLIPGGFVALESVRYTPDDYRRMVRMGANFQVIRMPLGEIGGWSGVAAKPDALAQFDAMVRMGREAGLRTVFKLVVYGIRPFGNEQWDELWRNTNGRQDALVAAWAKIWTRYRDEPSVFGYDLLNEPQRGLDLDYARTQRERHLPLLRRLSDAMHQINPGKWALYQPLLRKPEDQWAPGKNPVVAIEEAFGRERIIYAPHLYQMDLAVIKPMLDDFEQQAALAKAPLWLGEWGSPTRSTTDGNPAEQARFTKVYQFTANELDTRGIGAIKAWFCGTRSTIPVKGSPNWMTWAIFSDDSPAGRVERTYITDVLARPRPLVVAGRVGRYANDFAARVLELTLTSDPALGATEIFVPADRHYPRGFRVEIGPGLTLALDPGAATLRPVRAATAIDRDQAAQVRWNDGTQHLQIEKWIGAPQRLTVRILPET